MNEKIDLRGLRCPEPVIATKKVLDKKEIDLVEVLVDDDVCVANLERLARSLKAVCDVTDHNGYFSVNISKNVEAKHQHHASADAEISKIKADNNRKGMVIFFSRDQLGEGDPDFSRSLSNVFLQTLLEGGHPIRAILLANTGVRLLASSNASKKVLDDFRIAGTEVLACGLCVDFYRLKEDIAKEQITNMFAICEYLAGSEKVLQF